jgi:DNA polymerase III gamma/tau subunit
MPDNNLPLHTKYRPPGFDAFLGNDAMIESLKSTLSRDVGLPHAFLFQGPSGCGKTTLARIVSEVSLNCQEVKEYNAAESRGIDTIRAIANACLFAPLSGLCKVFILDEAHKLTDEAQSALLKLLEDTPKHVFFILCTTDPRKLKETIRQRCSTFQVATLQRAKLVNLLNHVCSEEGVTIASERIKQIATAAEGSPRRALVMLDQIIDLRDDEMAKQAIIDNSFNEPDALELCRAVYNKKWKETQDILRRIESDPESLRMAILGYGAKLMLGTGEMHEAQIMSYFMESFIYSGKPGLILACFLACKK